MEAGSMESHSHGDLRPNSKVREESRIWRANGRPELELLHGRYRNFVFSRHFHSVAAIGVVEQGAMACHWEGKEHETQTDTVILLNAGDVHAPGGGTSAPWAFRMFYLGGQLAHEFLGHDRPFARPFVKDPKLASAVLAAHRSFQGESAMAVESSLVSIISQLRPYVHSKSSIANASGSKVRRAQEYIEQHCTENISLRVLAAEVELSPYHLVRSFRKLCGIPPHVYLMQVRIERAQALLRSGTPLAEVAIRTGFVDQSHFSRHFKRFSGVTPGRYG
jgi:AraC-like DNA-binding protein